MLDFCVGFVTVYLRSVPRADNLFTTHRRGVAPHDLRYHRMSHRKRPAPCDTDPQTALPQASALRRVQRYPGLFQSSPDPGIAPIDITPILRTPLRLRKGRAIDDMHRHMRLKLHIGFAPGV